MLGRIAGDRPRLPHPPRRADAGHAVRRAGRHVDLRDGRDGLGGPAVARAGGVRARRIAFGGWAALWVVRAALAGLAIGLVGLACRRRGASVPAASMLALGGFVLAFVDLGMRPQTARRDCSSAAEPLGGRRASRPPRPDGGAADRRAVGGEHPRQLPAHHPARRVRVRRGSGRRRPRVASHGRVDGGRGGGDLPHPVRARSLGVRGRHLDRCADPRDGDGVGAAADAEASGALSIASALGLAVWLVRRRRRVPWRDLLWLGVFFVSAFTRMRSAVWWAVVVPVVVAGLLDATGERRTSRGRGHAPRVGDARPGRDRHVVVGIVWRSRGSAASPRTGCWRCATGAHRRGARRDRPGDPPVRPPAVGLVVRVRDAAIVPSSWTPASSCSPPRYGSRLPGERSPDARVGPRRWSAGRSTRSWPTRAGSCCRYCAMTPGGALPTRTTTACC